MNRFVLSMRIWWRTLFDARVREQVAQVLTGKTLAPPAPVAPAPSTSPPVTRPPAPAPKPPQRSEALTLLATLQREARLIDFLKESLTDYTDAQIGAAVRDIQRDAGKVLERLFKVRPISNQEEGAEVQAPADAERYRLVGTVSGSAPYRGQLVHHGWEATVCEIPEWTGSTPAAKVIAPVEVELL